MQILKEMPERIPMDGTFELTVRCNLKCKMCLFRHDDSENEEIIKNERTAEEWIDMARQVAEAGTFNLLITGGEPMLRKDFCEIYEGIYKQGFMLTLYTNATLVTPKIMETLRKYPPHRIGVTIYGASEETYEEVCGNGKAFNRAIEGMKLLSTLPSILEFRTTIIKDNYDEVDAIEDLVHREFGEDKTLTQTRMVNKAVRGACADVDSCRLLPEDNVRIFLRRGFNKLENLVGKDRFDIKKAKLEITEGDSQHSSKEIISLFGCDAGMKSYAISWDGKLGKDRFDIKKAKLEITEGDSQHSSKEIISLFGCDAGMKSYAISWDGKLIGCQMLGKFFTQPFINTFRKSWEEYPERTEVIKLNDKCVSCKNSNLCLCCYATRYAETGDLGGCPKYACDDVKELLKFL